MNKYAYNTVAKKLLALLLTVAIPLTGVSCQKTPEQPAAEAVETAEAGETAEAAETNNAAEAPVHGEVTLQEMIDSYHSVDPDALKPQIDLLEKYYQENS